MVNISKLGDSSIKFTFTDNDRYLYNGEITVPLNSLILVLDESDMAVFKKIDGDLFVSFLISNSNFSSKSDLETFYKNNMVGSTGGGATYSAGTNIDITDNVISMTVPISAGTGTGSIVEGYYTSAVGSYSHAEGYGTVADGIRSHAEGQACGTFGKASHAEGMGTSTYNDAEHASGKYNNSVSASTTFGDSGNTLFSVGNGTANNARHNAFEIRQNGDIYLTSGSTDIKLQDYLGGGITSGEVQTMIDDSISGKADTSAVTAVNDVLTAHTADTTIHVTSADKTAWNAKSDFSGSYNDLTDKPTIPTVPTSNTAFTNDAGYITEDALSGYAESSAVTEEITAAVSGKVDTTTFTAYSGDVETTLNGKQDTLIAGDNITINGNVISASGSSITIESAITSGSTNAVEGGAIYDAVNAPEYQIEGALSAKHFWDDENMGCYTEIGGSTSIKVPNSTLLNYPYIAYAFASDSEFMGGGVGYVATVTNGAITDLQMINGSSISSLTATYDGSYTYFTPSGGTFSGDSIGVIAVMGMDYEPTSFMDLGWAARENGADVGIISVVGSISAETLVNRVNRIYDDVGRLETFNPIADTITLNDNDGSGRNNDGVGYGILNYNTYNPLTDTTASGHTADIFKYSAIDFKNDDNILTFNGSAISMDKLKNRGAIATISAFTDGSSATTNNVLFNYYSCFIINTNSASSGGSNQQLRIDISGPNNKSGNIQLRLDNSNGLRVEVSYNDNSVSKTIKPFVLGSSYIIDTRKFGWGDDYGTHTLTVHNWQGSDFISSIKFYHTNNATIPIADIATDVAAGTYARKAEMFDELSHLAREEEVNFYYYGSPSAVTISTGHTEIRDFYGIVISGMSSTFNINVKTDDAIGNYVDDLTFNNNGSFTSEKFHDEPIPYYLNDEITKFENGVWNIYFAEGTKVNYLILHTTTEASAVIYKSFTETPIKDAVSSIQNSLSGYVETSAITSSVTSASTDSEIPTAKAVYDAIPTGGTGGGKTIEAGRGISITTGETADTVSINLPISAGTGENSIIIGMYDASRASTGKGSYSEGYAIKSSGQYSHAEGSNTYATANYAHAEGYYGRAKGEQSHAEGFDTNASGKTSHAEGTGTQTKNESEHASGHFNLSVSASTTFGDSGNTLFSVGNGTANNARHNAFEIRQNGDVYLNDGTNDVKLQDYLQIKVVKLTQSAYDALSPNYDSNTLYVIVN